MRWNIWSAVMPSVTQQVSKVQNGRCFGSVLLSFLKSLLMAATKGKTVGYLDLLSCVWYQSPQNQAYAVCRSQMAFILMG